MTRDFIIPKELMFDGTLPVNPNGIVLAELVPEKKALSPWQSERLGHITASRVPEIKYGKNKKDWSDGALTYLWELVFEWAEGVPALDFQGNEATRWGNNYERQALNEYIKRKGLRKVATERFFRATSKGFKGLVGATPDGIIKTQQGLISIEIKCPKANKNHMRTAMTGEIPDAYREQVITQMICTGAEKSIFLSFDPRITRRQDLRLIEVEFEPEKSELEDTRNKLIHFESTLIETLETLQIDWQNPSWRQN